MALRQLVAVGCQHRRQVRVPAASQRVKDVDLARRIVDVVVAADHVRDACRRRVDDNAEVVRRRTGARQPGRPAPRWRSRLALHRVVPRDDTFVRVAKADHRRDAWRRRHPLALRRQRRRSAASRQPSAPRAARHSRRHAVAICEAAREQIVQRGPVSLSAASGSTDPSSSSPTPRRRSLGFRRRALGVDIHTPRMNAPL